jgi:hypothetical protein
VAGGVGRAAFLLHTFPPFNTIRVCGDQGLYRHGHLRSPGLDDGALCEAARVAAEPNWRPVRRPAPRADRP